MKVGLGYNRLSGDVLSTPAVQGSSISSIQGAGGQQVTSDCITITDVETLHKSLGISVDAGGSYMGFSGSAKVDYANSCDFSSFSTYVVVRVSVQDAAETIDSPIFSPDANELLVNNNPDRFRQRFGDSFISGVRKGGEFFAIYQITGSDESEKESVAVKVRAAYGGGPLASAHLNTDINTDMSKSTSHLTVSCHVFRQGTIGIVDLNLEDIMVTAKQFSIGVSGDKAFPYAVLLQDYDSLKNPNDQFVYIEIQNRQDVLEDLAKKRFEFLALRDDLKYILKHSGDFQNADGTAVDRDKLSKDFDSVVDAINTMQREASVCTRDAKQCEFTKFDVAKFSVPVLAKGKTMPKTVPNFVGLRLAEANLLSQQTGILLFEEDTQEHPKFLGGAVEREHSSDQIIVNWQAQPPGSILQKSPVSTIKEDFLLITYDLAPGVPQ